MLGAPKPISVAIGPFSPTWLRRTDSTTPAYASSSEPASDRGLGETSSHSIATPAASMICRAACATSGPIPSPGISVTLCRIEVVDSTGNAPYCRSSAPAGVWPGTDDLNPDPVGTKPVQTPPRQAEGNPSPNGHSSCFRPGAFDRICYNRAG